MALLPMKFYAYIGPRHVAQDDDSTLYGHWNYIADLFNNTPEPYPLPPLDYVGLRTLTTTMSDRSSDLNISGTGLPSAAGVWVGPNGTGEGWEYMAYYSVGALKTAQREIQPPQTGYHTVGAPVYLWYPLGLNAGQVQYDQEQSDNMSTITWTAKLSGVMAPAAVLKPEHLIVVTGSTNLTLSEAQMPIIFLGTVERVQLSQDTQLNGTWEIDIVCTSRLLQQSTVPGLRLGPLNIALQADIQASSSLGAPWKLTLPQLDQVNAGTLTEIDLMEFQADLEPSNILDGSEDSLWVSDGWVGDRTAFANSAGCHGFASIYAYPVATDPYGTRYLEIIAQDALDVMTIWVMGYWWVRDADGNKLEPNPRAQWYQTTEFNFFQSQGMDNDSLKQENDNGDMGMVRENRIIIAEDLSVFQRVFPAAKAKFMLDAATYSGQDTDMVRRYWWEGGAVFLAFIGSTGDPPIHFNRSEMLVTWGEVTEDMAKDQWESDDLTPDVQFPAEAWHIPTTTGVYPNQTHLDKPGQVYRRVLTSATVNMTYDYIHMPGYVVDSDIEAEEGGNPSHRAEWFKIVLPEMSHFLRDDIGAGTSTIYLIDGQKQPNVEGISRFTGGGKIVVDDEVILFTGKNYKNGYLTGCTVTRNHKRGTRVYVRWALKAFGRAIAGAEGGGRYKAGTFMPQEDLIKQIATAGYPLERIEYGRGYFHANGAERYPYAGNYLVRFSVDPDAPDPSIDSWQNGYMNQLIDTAGSTDPVWVTPNVSALVNTAYFDPANDGFRPRTIFFGFRKMNDQYDNPMNIARPRMNYFRAFVDRFYFNPETWLDTIDTGFDNESQIMELMKLSGQYDNFFLYDTEPPPFGRHARKIGQTDRDTAWRVASDMADYGTSVIQCLRWGIVMVGMNKFLLSDTHDANAYLTDDNIISLEIVNVRPAEVGQIRLLWEDPFLGFTGVAVYPPTARYGGSIVEVGPLLLDDQAMAELVAKNLYKTRRFPYNIFVEYITGDWDVTAGMIHEIRYDFLRNGQMLYKLLMVETVSQTIANGIHRTQVGYREIDRGSV